MPGPWPAVEAPSDTPRPLRRELVGKMGGRRKSEKSEGTLRRDKQTDRPIIL
jgi:hypothetical protein